MNRYHSSVLTSKTNKTDKGKLVTALRAVPGVDRAELHPNTHEFEIHPNAKQSPNRDAIVAAAKEAGFKVSPKN